MADGPTPALRFDAQVDVEGKAPRDPNEAMAVWWRHFNFQTSIYGRGINIRTPSHPGAFDIVPLVDWLAKKTKEAKKAKEDRKRRELLRAEEDEPSGQ